MMMETRANDDDDDDDIREDELVSILLFSVRNDQQ